MVAIEHEMGLKQTEEMIRRDPSDVVFTRPTKGTTSAGGKATTGTTVTASQRVRMMPAQTETTQIPRRVSSDGQLAIPSYVLLAMPGADIAIGDTATIEGHNLEVVWCNDEPGWRVLFEAVEHR